MSNEITASMIRLKELAPRVQALESEAHQIVDRLESFLREECKLEFPVSVLVLSQPDDSGEILLSYERCGDEFQFRVTTRRTQRDEKDRPLRSPTGSLVFANTESKCWRDCDRPTRVMSFAKLPELLKQLTQTIEQTVSISERSNAAGRQLLSALSSS